MKIFTTIAAAFMAIVGVVVDGGHTSRRLIPGAEPIKLGTKTYTFGLRETIDVYIHCGGVLVAPILIATVKSCVDGSKPKFVSVGTHYLNQTLDGEQIPVASVLVHPNYRSLKSYNSVLLKLTKPSKFKPITLPKADDLDIQENMMATAMGWGKPDSPVFDVLLGVNLEVWGDSVCQEVEGADKTTLCAGGATRKDACIYYGGGPLVKEQREGDNDDILIGLTIWGQGCDNDGSPTVFSRVFSAVSWITSMS